MSIEIRDNVSQGLYRLPTQFDDSVYLRSFLETYLQGTQQVLDLGLDLLKGLRITDAVGVQLDNIGYVVGERRLARDDETFRTAIQAKIILNNSTGTPADVISATKAIAKTGFVGYWEHYPASAILSIGNENLATVPPEIVSVIDGAAPAGCSIDQILVDTDGDGLVFAEQIFEEGTIQLNEGSDLVTSVGDFVGYQIISLVTASSGGLFAEISQKDLIVDQTNGDPLEVDNSLLLVNGEVYETGTVTYSLNGFTWVITDQQSEPETGDIFYEVLTK